ncbi:hypothetical protein LOD99_409 [Oopsacas minuta]|uniref:VWFA domain-containing protein n=1 Tax=Oopsacas minuta TaxID=111878 RepID=A0AAV7K8K9_9METZ|nr:hypothetical protein LOD99_409 [Oopsacas minuta]
MTSLPPTCFKLEVISKDKEIKLENKEKLLTEYDIKDQSVIEIIPESEFWLSSWDQNFFASACLASWNDSQTVYGKSLFFASLYTLSIWIRKQSLNIRTNVLGHIRSITGCAPLIHALKLLFNKECLTLPHRVAIQEVLMLVYKSIGPKQLKGDVNSSITIQEKQILEESINFWAYFIEFAKEYHSSRTEEYSDFNLCCTIKNNRMRDPKRVMDSEGIPHIVDKANYTGKINNEMFEPLPEYVRIIKCFSGFEAQIWKEKAMVINEVDLTREWNTIITKCLEMKFLCIQLPLALKDHTCPVPCMILGENGMVCNYIGGSKDDSKSYEGFDPLGGNTFNFDADDLDETLRKGNHPQYAKLLKGSDTIATNTTVDFTTITRPLNEIEEIIMVVLDTSRSMDSQYFASKSKYELAMTGFEQFCNRTTAYNYKNMIGLVIFGGTSKLELELTESFRHFSKEIRSFPNKGSTAIYDAIIFTIEYINSFKSKHSFPNTLKARILCLTRWW